MDRALLLFLVGVVLFSARLELGGQTVQVTLSLDTNQVSAGQTTFLKVFAQIGPAVRPNSDRIFSWYVDFLQSNGEVAEAVYTNLTKPFSDNHPQTSSAGTPSGSGLRGIYDTFLNQPGAGKEAPILLFSLPVRGLSSGETTFRIGKGSGENLAHDFIVAPAGGGDPYTGGDYSQAFITMTVGESGAAAAPRVNISHSFSDGQNHVTITFPASAGANYIVEFRDAVGSGGAWEPLAGAPHNNGSASDTNSVPTRFYRVRMN